MVSSKSPPRVADEDHVAKPQAAPTSAPLTYETWREILAAERLPAAVVDLEAFDRNVAQVAEVLRQGGHGHTLRIATKSIRVPALIRRVLDYGPPYAGLMCYAVEEAAFLAEQGFDDLLVAYPSVQDSDLQLLRTMTDSGRTVRLVLDAVEQLERLSAANVGADKPLLVVLDVDMSLRPFGGRVHLGVRRSPLRTVDQVLELYRRALDLPGVRVVGLMGYEAQVAGLGDRNPFQKALNPVARFIRRRSMRAVARLRQQLAEKIYAAGYELELFNGGGTGSVNLAVAEPWLTELTVGSGFLCSHLFDYYSNIRLEPACFFALQRTRSSDEQFITCAGGGFIASGSPGWDKVPRPYLPAGLKLVSTEGCGEVQTPLELTGAGSETDGRRLQPGDPVLFRHAKAGELAEHFREYLLVAGGKIIDRVPTYRGLGQAFL